MPSIPIVPLSRAAFAGFGDVVELSGTQPLSINQGFTERFNDLANIDVLAEGGAVNVSMFVCNSRPKPVAIKLMERHPLGSQLFYPLQDRPWSVLVCTAPEDFSTYRAFTASGRQGVNYARNVWHHPLLVLDDASRFLIVDRKGGGHNLEEIWLNDIQPLTLAL